MRGKQILAIFAALAVTLSGAALPVVAAGGALNWSADSPDIYYSGDLTIDDYSVDDGGDLVYENDNGERTSIDGMVNSTTEHDELGNGHVNPYSFVTTDIDDSQFAEFPRKSDESGDNSASALDASEYTTSGAAVADVNTAPGVDAVEYTASAAGDSATYSNFSITSDAEKRFLSISYDIVDASGASEINLTIHDATDGDTAVVQLYDADGQTSSDSVFANSTGEGKFGQVQVGTLSVSGGDGTMDEIGSVEISADGAAEVEANLVDLEKTSKYKLGERYHDSDDDDELETETVYESTGTLNLMDISTMGTWADDAHIMGLSVPVHVDAASQEDSAIQAEFSDAEQYPAFGSVLDLYVGMQLPAQFDLSWSNVELRLAQDYADSRYVSAEYAEGVDESTAFDDISDSSFTSFSGSLGNADTEYVVDSTVQPGDRNVVHVELKLTGDEASALQASGSGGGGIFATGGGGIMDTIFGLPGAIGAVVLGLFGRAKGWF